MDYWQYLPPLTLFFYLIVGLCLAHSNNFPPADDMEMPVENIPPKVTIDMHSNQFREQHQNKEHIMEHLDGVVDKKEEDMSDDELHFHYFKSHDVDNNMKLDGLEIINAMTHYHQDEDNSPGEPQPPSLSEKDMENMIDTILKEDDLNGDGYIDYSEYTLTQKRPED